MHGIIVVPLSTLIFIITFSACAYGSADGCCCGYIFYDLCILYFVPHTMLWKHTCSWDGMCSCIFVTFFFRLLILLINLFVYSSAFVSNWGKFYALIRRSMIADLLRAAYRTQSKPFSFNVEESSAYKLFFVYIYPWTICKVYATHVPEYGRSFNENFQNSLLFSRCYSTDSIWNGWWRSSLRPL